MTAGIPQQELWKWYGTVINLLQMYGNSKYLTDGLLRNSVFIFDGFLPSLKYNKEQVLKFGGFLHFSISISTMNTGRENNYCCHHEDIYKLLSLLHNNWISWEDIYF